jgi:ABC-type multidrug transport system fused ATPase/permease subunit
LSLEKVANYFRDPVEALGQVYTCLKIVNSPATAPISLATLQLVNSAMTSLTQKTRTLGSNIDGLSGQVGNIRDFYTRLDLQNRIPDGSVPFPENAQDISLGISVEFRNVTFGYTEKDDLVLKNVSFKIEQGQLCVSP